MKAVQTNLHDFIAESRLFRIPDFQRPYAWRRVQGEAFWNSLKDTASNSRRHYFGSVVFFEEDNSRVIIDGQQRLTTSLLFITACYHALIEDSRRAWNYTAEQIGKTYLYDEDNGELRVILRGATTDRMTFDRILRRKVLPIDEESKLYAMYLYFVECISAVDTLDIYIDVLSRIDVISILLSAEDDNPQIIFENINATGEPLTDGDKIRNFALMLNTEDARNMVYNDYWLHIEKQLVRSKKFHGVGSDHTTEFFRIFLTLKYDDKKVNERNVYEYFKLYYRERTSSQSTEELRAFWSEIMSILEDYIYLDFHEDITDGKKLSVFDEQQLEIAFAVGKGSRSFCIRLLEYYKAGHITRNDFRNIITTLRKHIFRGMIVNDKKGKLTHSTAQIAYKLYKTYEMRSYFDAYLWYMEGAGDPYSSKNISDESIMDSITNDDISDGLASFILSDIDAAYDDNSPSLRKRLDRIMPKAAHGWRLEDVWKEELGEKWETINQRFYNKLANTALVDYAPSTHKKDSFTQKMDMHDGLSGADNYTTKWIADSCSTWNIEALEARTKWLRDEVVKVYEIPRAIVSDKIKDKYGRHDTVS